jgi:hypothetical protein
MNISDADKKVAAQDALKMHELSLYRQLVIIGEDPDTFDINTLSEDMDLADAEKFKAVQDLVNKINKIKEIIERYS